MKAIRIIDGALRDDGDYRWTRPGDLAGEALPTVMRKMVAACAGRNAETPAQVNYRRPPTSSICASMSAGSS